MNIFVPDNKNITFSSIRPQLEVGRSILRSFKKEYPFLKSNTMLLARCRNLIHDENYIPEILEKSICKAFDWSDIILSGIPQRDSLSANNYLEQLKLVISRMKYANCEEIADIILEKLKIAKLPQVHTIMSAPITKHNGHIEYLKGHVFNIFNLNEDFIPNMPKTWGNKAIIVDGWLNFAEPAHEGIRKIKSFFGVSDKTERMLYKLDDLI